MLEKNSRTNYIYKISITCIASLILILAFSPPSYSQADSLIDLAKSEFDNANYPQALEYLNQARELHPDNAEVYYYLGFFLHYLCYDSMPLSGYGRETSDKVLEYLKKSVELDPSNGNAFYFIGAEYGVRAREALRNNDKSKAKKEFQEGMDSGGYPPWMIEYGRNTLKSCQPDAILITQGDAETNAVEYLQIVEDYRTDVTVIPYALLNRPRFVMTLKNGVDDYLRSAPISMSDNQIYSMRPYKWKENIVPIPIDESIREKLNLDSDAVDWTVSPDLGRGGELRYLDAGQAVLVDIFKTNQWRRPIHFTLPCPPSAYAGLESHIQQSGMIRNVRPYIPDNNIDFTATTEFLNDKNNFKDLHTVQEDDFPRVSGMLQIYRNLYLQTIYKYVQQGDNESGKELYFKMLSYIPEDILPIMDQLKNPMEYFRKTFEEDN